MSTETEEAWKPKLVNRSYADVLKAWAAYRDHPDDDPWGKRYQWWRYCEMRDGVAPNEYPDNLHRYTTIVYKRFANC